MSQSEEYAQINIELTRYKEMNEIMSEALKLISRGEEPAKSIADAAFVKCIPIRMR
jgi:hypothetical protein